jgi:hypothetical protein
MGESSFGSQAAKRASFSASLRSFLLSLEVMARILRGLATRTSWPKLSSKRQTQGE